MKKNIDIVTERPWFSPGIIKILEEKGYLNRVYTGFPRKRFSKTGLEPDRIRSRPLAAVWNYGLKRSGLSFLPTLNEPLSLASYVANQEDLAPVVSCLGTSYMYLFPRIVNRQIIRVIECGAMHPEDHHVFQQKGLKEAGARFDFAIPRLVVEESTIARQAHVLICGSKMVADSYTRRGYDPERILVCPYGIDTDRFRYIERGVFPARPIRVATVGMVCIRKGIVRLLRMGEWARAANIDLELHLIGPVEDEVRHLLKSASAKLVLHGVLKGNGLIKQLHNADLFCLPSYEEGFPVAQVEAMATGLPSVTSNDTGGREAITHGRDGLVLTQFTNSEFDSVLGPWLRDPGQLRTAGKIAAEKVRRYYSKTAYARSLSSAYEMTMELAEKIQHGESVNTSYPGATDRRDRPLMKASDRVDNYALS